MMLALFIIPLTIAAALLLPAFFGMIAINCILDIHWPGHHVGYGEAYAIVYIAGLFGASKTVTLNKTNDK